MKSKFFVVILLVAMLAGSGNGRAAERMPMPDFQEVYSLVRSNMTGATPAELDRAALRGLLDQFQGRLQLLTSETDRAEAATLTKSTVYEDFYGYFRVGEVEAGLADAFQTAVQEFNQTNQLKGIVLDLRFAEGRDYAAAVALTDLFLKKEGPVLSVGGQAHHSTAKEKAITTPVAVLVNIQTAGAAEALAAAMRNHNLALIIGATTAGQAYAVREFNLSNGQRLRVATDPVRLPKGTVLSQGVKPDIALEVKPGDEQAYFEDAYVVLPHTVAQTSPLAARGARRSINEAELVRRHREGIGPDEPFGEAAPAEPERPVIRDPALGRALDLLKGLSVVKQYRPL